MDIIYTDATGRDIGVITNCSLDYEASTDKDDCNYEIKTDMYSDLKKGYYVYVEGSEYGGRIDTLSIDTADSLMRASGRSWRGILGSKVIEPPADEDYYIVSGDLNGIIRELLRYAELDGIFVVDESHVNIKSHKFYRYTDLYSGIIRLLSTNGYKLKIEYQRGKVHLAAVPIVDYSREREISSDMFDFEITTSTPVNHVIGLGKGDLSSRQVVHKYLDANGNVTDTKHYTGVDEITITYENTDCEAEELPEKTADKLKELSASDTLDIKAYNLDADIGDKFVANEIQLGISIEQYVTDKTVLISDQTTKIQYKVGNKV